MSENGQSSNLPLTIGDVQPWHISFMWNRLESHENQIQQLVVDSIEMKGSLGRIDERTERIDKYLSRLIDGDYVLPICKAKDVELLELSKRIHAVETKDPLCSTCPSTVKLNTVIDSRKTRTDWETWFIRAAGAGIIILATTHVWNWISG